MIVNSEDAAGTQDRVASAGWAVSKLTGVAPLQDCELPGKVQEHGTEWHGARCLKTGGTGAFPKSRLLGTLQDHTVEWHRAGCSQTGEGGALSKSRLPGKLQDHFKVCDDYLVNCPDCEQCMSRKMLRDYHDDCPAKGGGES